MKRLVLPMALLILAACAAPQVTMPSGAATVMWGNFRADYAIGKLIMTQACRGGKVDKDSCDSAKALDERAQIYRQAVEASLMNPSQPVDWQQVMQFSEAALGMLMKFGVVP